MEIKDTGPNIIMVECQSREEGIMKCAKELISKYAEETAPEACEICGRKFEDNAKKLRPFGPKYQWICKDCGIEHEPTTSVHYMKLMMHLMDIVDKKATFRSLESCPKS